MDQKEGTHRQDVACARCRERKVRCGRQRPACATCQSDNTECDYSVPEKRVNHTKILCNNFDRLEYRLNNIEGELSWLTALLKTGGPQQVIASSEPREPAEENVTQTEDQHADCIVRETTADRRIICGLDGQGDQYHGPGTLLSLCYEIKEAVLSKESIVQPTEANDAVVSNDSAEEAGNENDPPTRNDTQSIFYVNDRHTELLDRICIAASFEPPLEATEHVPIRLPPKQLLTMALPQFFSQVDYSTDIFVDTHFAAQIERIYVQAPIPSNEAWAICFNTIILLVLGSESWTGGNDPLMASHFALPLFQAMQAALHQARFLTTPKLINVQALALLSIAAERYYPAATNSAVFAQACLLGRRTGLHQANVTSPSISQDEATERFKTFTSLHLRDKTLSLTLSSICWLPSFDHSVSLQIIPSMFADPRIEARARLADIQEQLYRYLSMEPHHAPQQASSELTSIFRNLDSWANSYEVYTLPFSSSHEAVLQLTFLATRMLAYRRSGDEAHAQALLDDARASCLVLLVACEKHDQGMLNTLQSLRRPRKITISSSNGSTPNTPCAGRLTSLINAFPVTAFFQLTNHILWPRESGEASKADEAARTDLELLQDVHSCAIEVNNRTQSQNRASQVERTFGNLLELIQALTHVGPDQGQYYDLTGPSSQVRTPNTSSLGSGVGEFPLNPTLASTTDMSWDFLASPFQDAMLNFDGETEGGDGRRKRPRTSDVGFSIDGDSLVPFLSTGLDFDLH